LRDLVAATLENSGILGKIKAQLRANVYIALEEGDNVKNKSKLINQKLADFLSTTNGRLVAGLVREFLEFFDLNYSLAVFDPETNIGKDVKLRERSKLCEALGLTELTDTKAPLLSEILRLSKASVLKSESPTPTEVSVDDDGHTSAHISLQDDDTITSRSEKDNVQKNDDISESSDSKTPEILLKDNFDLLKRSTYAAAKSDVVKIDPGDSLKSIGETVKPKESFLSDLPPLGSKSSLSDLPPLTSGRNLAPLSKIPSKNNTAGQNIVTKKDPISSKPSKKDVIAADKPLAKKKIEGVPKLGFDSDHVISEKTDTYKKENKTQDGETSQEVTENIEEDLDSFLNSDLSTADMTEDKTIYEDASLKADYVESL